MRPISSQPVQAHFVSRCLLWRLTIAGSLGVLVLPTVSLAQSGSLAQLEGRPVAIALTGVRELSDVLVTRVDLDKRGRIRRLTVRDHARRDAATFDPPLEEITEIYDDGVPMDVAYDSDTATLAFHPEKRTRRRESERAIRAGLARVGAKLWDRPTREQHASAFARQLALVKQTRELFPGRALRSVETRFFLFLTDATPRQIDPLITRLDAMYAKLCEAYVLPPTRNIWLGKCLVVLFQAKSDLRHFESILMNHRDQRARGYCQYLPDGRVIISGYQGDSGFVRTMVHETAHGFQYRYLSSVSAPSWLDEGLAEWVALALAPDGVVDIRQQQSALRFAVAGDLGRFFTMRQIDGDMYGAASGMIAILMKLDEGKGRFGAFLTGIKMASPRKRRCKTPTGLATIDWHRLTYCSPRRCSASASVGAGKRRDLGSDSRGLLHQSFPCLRASKGVGGTRSAAPASHPRRRPSTRTRTRRARLSETARRSRLRGTDETARLGCH